MNVYVDCEFNGFGGELISMALVAEDGREWYALTEFLAFSNTPIEPWVQENVVTVIDKPKIPEVHVSRDTFRRSFHDFLSQFENPNIVADWYTDLVHFFQCYQGGDHTESFSLRCTAELRTDIEEYTSEFPHNALSDARAIRNVLARIAV